MTGPRSPRWPIVTGAAVGAVLFAVGVRSLLQAARDTHPTAAAAWVVGLAVAHDLLLVPFTLVVGVAVKRLMPGSMRPWLGAGLLISGALSLVAWPLVRGYGRSAGNPSILPRNYGAGLAGTLIVVWTGILVFGVLLRRRRPSQPERPPR